MDETLHRDATSARSITFVADLASTKTRATKGVVEITIRRGDDGAAFLALLQDMLTGANIRPAEAIESLANGVRPEDLVEILRNNDVEALVRIDPHGGNKQARAEKIVAKSPAAAISVVLARLYASKAMDKIELAGRKVIAAAAEGDALRTQMAILRRLAKHEPANTIALGREAAAHMVKAGRYSI